MDYEAQVDSEQLSRREREKLRHRIEIIEAATKVFARRGFHMATLDEVAQEAEFSKGALYLHFSSKEDLLYSLVKYKMQLFSGIVQNQLNAELPFKQVLKKMYNSMAELSFSERDFFKIVMTQYANEYGAFSEEKSAEFKQGHIEFWTELREAVVVAQERGELRNITPDAIIGLVHGALDNMLMARWGCDDLDCLKKAVDSFVDILFNGIAKEREAVQ